jgi:hypothetical protein
MPSANELHRQPGQIPSNLPMGPSRIGLGGVRACVALDSAVGEATIANLTHRISARNATPTLPKRTSEPQFQASLGGKL